MNALAKRAQLSLPNRYLLFHKPYDVLCQFSGGEPGSRRTLMDFIPVSGVYPAGRLDRDSEGLLLLTNDGAMQHRLTDPKFAHPRSYWVQVEGVPDERDLQRLRDGVEIPGYRTLPAQATLLPLEPDLPSRNPPIRVRKSIPTAWIGIALTEGRNRQVRHMTAAIGHPTLRLVRFAIGELRLEGLAPGQWRDLKPAELAALKARTAGTRTGRPTARPRSASRAR
jgi:23S rRNA pseudouridine2457 synthase